MLLGGDGTLLMALLSGKQVALFLWHCALIHPLVIIEAHLLERVMERHYLKDWTSTCLPRPKPWWATSFISYWRRPIQLNPPTTQGSET